LCPHNLKKMLMLQSQMTDEKPKKKKIVKVCCNVVKMAKKSNKRLLNEDSMIESDSKHGQKLKKINKDYGALYIPFNAASPNRKRRR